MSQVIQSREPTGIGALRPSDVNYIPPLIQCLSTLLRLRGKSVSPQFLMAGLGSGFITPKACIRACRKAGLAGSILYRPKLSTINPLVLPCIVLLTKERCCVVTNISDDTVSVIFPETEETCQQVPLEELEKEYSGYAIFAQLPAEPEERIEKLRVAKDKQWFWDVLKFYAPIYRHVALASLIINLIAIASPLFVMSVYDRVIPNNATETLWVLAFGVLIVYLANFVLSLLRTHFVDTAGRNADVVLSSMLMDRILSMRLDDKPESTGALVNNIREFEQIREFFSSSSMVALIDIPFLFIFVFLTALIGGNLVCVPLLALPILFIIGMTLQKVSSDNAEKNFKQNMHKNALLVEIVNGLETIKSCMAETRMQDVWEKSVGIAAKSASISRKYAALAISSSVLVSQIATIVLMIWGVSEIAAGNMTMGALIGCTILVGRALAPMLQLSNLLARFQNARIALKTLDLLMKLRTETINDQSVTKTTQMRPSFALDDVSFSYPGSRRLALDHVSVHIEPGEKVGIIGSMGSGKSTLARLLLGLYQPSSGAVRFGDVDIRQIPLSDYRGRIGVLPQDIVLFYGTVKDNITLGDPTINDHMVFRAAAISGVADFLKNKPDGFAMQVGEQGKYLSGGQRQAVALARALVRDPEVLFLDEPTSNMDIDAEAILQKRLLTTLGERTLLLATHRYSMLKIVDRVIVLENGHIKYDGERDKVIQKLREQSQMLQAKMTKELNTGQE